MKIRVEVEVGPKELREFLGLPEQMQIPLLEESASETGINHPL